MLNRKWKNLEVVCAIILKLEIFAPNKTNKIHVLSHFASSFNCNHNFNSIVSLFSRHLSKLSAGNWVGLRRFVKKIFTTHSLFKKIFIELRKSILHKLYCTLLRISRVYLGILGHIHMKYPLFLNCDLHPSPPYLLRTHNPNNISSL